MDERCELETLLALRNGLAELVHSLLSVSWVDAVKGEKFIRILFHQFIHKVVRYRLSLRLISLQEIARHFPHVDHSLQIVALLRTHSSWDEKGYGIVR